MKRTVALLAATAALAALLERTLVLEDDPVRSLTHPDPAAGALFERFQERSPFRGKIFVDAGALSPRERGAVEERLRDAGYREEPLLAAPSVERLVSLSPLLPADEVKDLLGATATEARARDALAMAALPGGDAYLERIRSDPAGLARAAVARAFGDAPRGAGEGAGAGLRVYRSPTPLDYEKVGALYDALVAAGPRARFIGADFFAVENYRAAKRDMIVCSTFALVLNAAAFFFFTSRWALLGLLLLGTGVSYVTGLLAIRAFYPQIFAIVLAYTSTFVGFNNESLVHLAGIEGETRRRTLLGVWSAIGTTVIGFVILLFGRSVIVRQMALASLGGTAGFLLFLLPYRNVLRAVRFRGFEWPKLTASPRAVAVLCAACACGVALAGVPPIRTRIEEFRYQTPALAAQVARFGGALDALGLENVVAVPVSGSPGAALAALAARGLVDPARHPLALWRPPASQEETLRTIRAEYPRSVARLSSSLSAAGLRIDLPPSGPPLRPLGEWEFLEAIGDVGPIRWTDRIGAQRYLFVGLRPGAAMPADGAAWAMSPRHHYDALLTGLSRDLGWLFLAGLAAMTCYLAVLQRSASRVLYVLAPLFPSALAFAIYARLSGATLDIVHFMAFSLVIALALDYTAVTVTSDHAPSESSRVLFTGVSTLLTFGILAIARHPVLRSLGITVALGCGVSLVFALFVRLAPSTKGAP